MAINIIIGYSTKLNKNIPILYESDVSLREREKRKREKIQSISNHTMKLLKQYTNPNGATMLREEWL